MTWTESVPRTSGKPYRARTRPVVTELVDDYDDFTGLLVQRTHDVDVATALAWRWWGYRGQAGPLPTPEPCWRRYVPWGHDGGTYEWATNPDERGAVPCVWFGVHG